LVPEDIMVYSVTGFAFIGIFLITWFEWKSLLPLRLQYYSSI